MLTFAKKHDAAINCRRMVVKSWNIKFRVFFHLLRSLRALEVVWGGGGEGGEGRSFKKMKFCALGGSKLAKPEAVAVMKVDTEPKNNFGESVGLARE